MQGRAIPAGLDLRIALILLGLSSLAWAGVVLLAWPQPAAVEQSAARIVRGDRYKPEDLDRLAPLLAGIEAAPWSRAASVRAAAIVELRRAESALTDGRREDIDRHLGTLERLIPRALDAAPSDAFLWLALFWRDNLALGVDPARLAVLDMSYRTGPNEGWVGVRRSPVSLALFRLMPPALRERAITEFAGLVQSRFAEMPDILGGPGWAARDALLPRLARVDEPQRRTFARALYRAGIDVNVPGIDRPDDRPWSR